MNLSMIFIFFWEFSLSFLVKKDLEAKNREKTRRKLEEESETEREQSEDFRRRLNDKIMINEEIQTMLQKYSEMGIRIPGKSVSIWPVGHRWIVVDRRMYFDGYWNCTDLSRHCYQMTPRIILEFSWKIQRMFTLSHNHKTCRPPDLLSQRTQAHRHSQRQL